MEEGPEPQELIERTVEHQHHEHEHAHEPETKRRAMMAAAITAAGLAVLAAVGSLLSGHAANQAILLQTRASDTWSYYQAKSTKGHIYEADKAVVEALAKLQGAGGEKVGDEVKFFDKQADKYRSEKEEIEKEARELEAKSGHEFTKHLWFAMGIAAFQVGIVLCSISIIVPQQHLVRTLYGLGVAAGVLGVVLLFCGLFTPEPSPPASSQRQASPAPQGY